MSINNRTSFNELIDRLVGVDISDYKEEHLFDNKPDGGIWKKEADKYTFQLSGYKCLILRCNDVWSLCGYVGLPKGNILCDVPYEKLLSLRCHGGLTFARWGKGELREKNIYWIGFDCSHCDDFTPNNIGTALEKYGEYRNAIYVFHEIQSLVYDLSKLMDLLESLMGKEVVWNNKK